MITILATLFVVYILYTLRTKKKNRPPLASGAWPIVGHAVKFIKNPEEVYNLIMNYSMESIRRDEALTVLILGKEVYGITNPEDAMTVLNSCLQKDVIYNYFKPWVGEGLFVATEIPWRRHHKLLSPTFSQRVMDSYLPNINQQAKALVCKLGAEVGKGKFNHMPYFEDATLQSICSTAMGVIIDNKDTELREQYFKLKTEFYIGIIQRAQKFWLQSEFMYNISGLRKKQDELGNILRGLTTSIIKKRETELSHNRNIEEKGPKSFMEHLLDMKKCGLLTETEVQEEVDTFTVTGSDTMAITFVFALLVIGTYPDVQRKIMEELKLVFQGSLRDVHKQDLSQLTYLEAVIKETWRLYPIVPIVGRLLDKDIRLRNYTLPSGSRCFVSLYGVNRHPSWGPDAEQFRPERWLDASVPSLQFAAFGFGKRRCVGSNFAVMSAKTMLAHVLRHYVVSGDVRELVCEWSVAARPVPKDYISIERRTEYFGQKELIQHTYTKNTIY